MNHYTRDLEFDDRKHQYSVNGVVIPSVSEIIGPITYTQYSVQQNAVDQAAHRGTTVHALTELYDRGDLEEESTIASDEALYLMAWIKFLHDYQPKWEFIEMPLACRTFAGTIDRIGTIDGQLAIVDIKTTSSMDRVHKIALACQIAGYWDLCQLNDIDVKYWNSMGVQLKKDGTYTVHETMKIRDKYQFDPVEWFHKMQNLNSLVKGERFIE